MDWNDVLPTKYEDLNLTNNGEVIKKKRKLKYGGVLVQYNDLETGKPRVAIYEMISHGDSIWRTTPTDYYTVWGSPQPANLEAALVARWDELNATKKKAKGKKKCEADRAARHGHRGHFQIYDEKHPYSW